MTTTRILTIAIDDTTDVPDGQIAELIHRLIPGSHTLSNTELSADLTDFEWDLEDESALELPLGATEAGTLMDGDGDVTIVTTIDQDAYLEAHASFEFNRESDHHDLLHEKCFDFGLPYVCRTSIIAVSDDKFVVSYTTNIGENLKEN